jgi:hypothetical protein
MLTPEALAEEFERIDTGLHDGDGAGADGYISREELWDFLSSGKAGEMNQKDFNALFEALDTDGNGKVDFLEFCSFLSMCGEEFQVAREDHFAADTKKARRGSTTNNSQQFQKIAKRISLASSKHLSVEDLKNPNSSSEEEAEETDRKASEGGDDSEGVA